MTPERKAQFRKLCADDHARNAEGDEWLNSYRMALPETLTALDEEEALLDGAVAGLLDGKLTTILRRLKGTLGDRAQRIAQLEDAMRTLADATDKYIQRAGWPAPVVVALETARAALAGAKEIP